MELAVLDWNAALRAAPPIVRPSVLSVPLTVTFSSKVRVKLIVWPAT